MSARPTWSEHPKAATPPPGLCGFCPPPPDALPKRARCAQRCARDVPGVLLFRKSLFRKSLSRKSKRLGHCSARPLARGPHEHRSPKRTAFQERYVRSLLDANRISSRRTFSSLVQAGLAPWPTGGRAARIAFAFAQPSARAVGRARDPRVVFRGPAPADILEFERASSLAPPGVRRSRNRTRNPLF